MEIDTISFTCGHCGTELLVPAAAAGIEGPCPRCGTLICAPRFELFEEPEIEPVPVRLEVERSEPQLLVIEEPVEEQPIRLFVDEPAVAPLRLEREEPLPIAKPRMMPSLKPVDDIPFAESSLDRSIRKERALKWVTFSLLGLALLVGIAAIYRNEQLKEELRKEKPQVVVPQGESAEFVVLTEKEPLLTEPREPISDSLIPPDGTDPRKLAEEGAQVLAKFMTAKTLQERLPLIETDTPLEELEQSVLAKSFPAVLKFNSEALTFNKIEGYSEVSYRILFEKEIEKSQLLIVRNRGNQGARVVVEPFLDGYGGRISAFIAGPKNESQTFRTLVSVFDFCSSADVPNAENKKTMKITMTRGGADLTKAYFGKFSPLGKKLESLGLKYGVTTPATVTLRWNTIEDPARPFLEVVDVRSLQWD